MQRQTNNKKNPTRCFIYVCSVCDCNLCILAIKCVFKKSIFNSRKDIWDTLMALTYQKTKQKTG